MSGQDFLDEEKTRKSLIMNCKGCVLDNSAKHTAVRDKTLKINERYRPSKIKMLFIAESPPIDFRKNNAKYFYACSECEFDKKGLFYHLMSVVFKKKEAQFSEKRKCYFLDKFEKKGYYLVDMVKCPINELSETKKIKAIKSCARHLNNELRRLNPDKCIFIGKGTFGKIKPRLNDTYHNCAVIPLPFRSDKNVKNFRRELKNFLQLDK